MRCTDQCFGLAIAVDVGHECHGSPCGVSARLADELPIASLAHESVDSDAAVGVAVGGVGRGKSLCGERISGAGSPTWRGLGAGRSADEHVEVAVVAGSRERYAGAEAASGGGAANHPGCAFGADLGERHGAVGAAIGGVGGREVSARDEVEAAAVAPAGCASLSRCANQHVGDVIAVHVAGARNAGAGFGTCRSSLDAP